jgi:predicted nuclease with TOPRIM domain
LEIEQQQQSSSEAEWQSKIKEIEDEKERLQKEISKIRNQVAVAKLKKKFRALEEEVSQLKTVKLDLEEQLEEQLDSIDITPAETPIPKPPTDQVEKPPDQTEKTVIPVPENQPNNEPHSRLRHFSF